MYPDGTVCISILHTPGDDPTMYEQASERWSPVQSVEKVLLSVISMLAGMSHSCRLSLHIRRSSNTARSDTSVKLRWNAFQTISLTFSYGTKVTHRLPHMVVPTRLRQCIVDLHLSFILSTLLSLIVSLRSWSMRFILSEYLVVSRNVTSSPWTVVCTSDSSRS